MYEQTLYKIVEPIKKTTISRLNKKRKWEYGYNKENDIVVISKLEKLDKWWRFKVCELGCRLNRNECICLTKTSGKK